MFKRFTSVKNYAIVYVCMSNKVTPQKLAVVQHKTGKKLTLKQKNLLLELPHSKTLTEAGRKAGYKDSKYLPQIVNKAINHSGLKAYIEHLGLVGLATLEEIALSGKNEVARVNASTKLVEQAYGKPKDQTIETGNILIQIYRI